MLKDTIKKEITSAMKSGDHLKRDIFKLVLGEIQSQETRTGKDISDYKIESIIRKLIESNKEVLSHKQDERLSQENAILETLPQTKTMTIEEIEKYLERSGEEIRAANNDGQAMGIAMKAMKLCEGKALGQDIKEAVSIMRGFHQEG